MSEEWTLRAMLSYVPFPLNDMSLSDCEIFVSKSLVCDWCWNEIFLSDEFAKVCWSSFAEDGGTNFL